MWKVRDLKEFCNSWDCEDNDVVRVYSFDNEGNIVFFDDNFLITTRKPCRTDFTHVECGYCDEIAFKGIKGFFCNYREDFISKSDLHSCENFEPKDKDLELF